MGVKVIVFCLAVHLYWSLKMVACDSFPCKRNSDICGCVFTKTDNNITEKYYITMSDVSKHGDPFFKDEPKGSTEWAYSLNPCSGFTESDCHDVTGCQIYDKKKYFPIGKLGTEEYSDFDGKSLTVSSTASSDETRTMIVTLQCTDTREPKLTVNGQQGQDPKYLFTLTGKSFCPRKYVPKPAGSNSSGGLSTGSILVIVFFVILVVYLVAGILFMKYRREATGKEVIPNVEFWSSLPGLIKGGCVFTFNQLKKLCHRDSYEEI